MGQLELAGIAEAAEILGVPASRIKRWQKYGEGSQGRRMPPTVAETRATPVWVREDIIAMRDGATTFPEREQLPVVGLSDAADLLKVNKSQIGRWRRAGKFPPHIPSSEPGATDKTPTLRATPLWMRNDVLAFDAQTSAAA